MNGLKQQQKQNQEWKKTWIYLDRCHNRIKLTKRPTNFHNILYGYIYIYINYFLCEVKKKQIQRRKKHFSNNSFEFGLGR